MTLKEYKAELTNIFKRNTHCGLVDYRHCRYLYMDTEKLLTQASVEMLGECRDKEFFDLICAAYLKWARTNKDDSDGHTQDFVCFCACDNWDKIYKRQHPDIPHKKMLDWFIKKSAGADLDVLEEPLLKYMMEHFKEPDLQEKKLVFLNERIAEKEKTVNENSWETFEIRYCRNCILQIYSEQKRPIEEIREYVHKYENSDSKELLAQIELSYGNQTEGLAIYEDLAANCRPFEQSRYIGKLKDLYKQYGLRAQYEEKVQKLLQFEVGDMDLWQEYKALIPEAEWEEKVNQLFSSFSPHNWRALPWYKAEKRYDLLMNTVEITGAYYLEEYENELAPRYPDRCLTILAEAADEAAENGSNRSEYKKIAHYLKSMFRYPGGIEKAAELAEIYRRKYPRRKAMIEELRGI